jgi:hypothetical protein
MPNATVPTHRRAIVICLWAVATALVCGALLMAVALVPAPTVVVPVAIVVCIACSMGAGLELSRALAAVRRDRRGHRRELRALRRQLAALPETRHPLGF